jgi:hypothetical protein
VRVLPVRSVCEHAHNVDHSAAVYTGIAVILA